MRPSERIANQKPYYFDILNQQINRLKSDGRDVIRLDIGSPDLPPAPFIVESLISAAKNPKLHGYSPYGGTLEFRQAVAQYYRQRFEVDLDAKTEVLGLIGSKEGIFHITQGILDPGDLALIPHPAYTTYQVGAIFCGAETYSLPLLEENAYLPDLDSIPEEIARRAKILWLNYPNNPTGAVADMDFLEKAVRFAHKYQVILLHDAPYLEIYFGGDRPHSILEIPDAKEIALELNSLSKSYNMAGWRVGMAVGNPELVSYLHAVKMQIDSSHFLPIQTAAITAMTGDQTWIAERNEIYHGRLKSVLAGLADMGFDLIPPKATIYAWFRLPDGSDDQQFCDDLLEAEGVSLTPGSVYGEAGRGYVRISLCTPAERIEEAMARTYKWVKGVR